MTEVILDLHDVPSLDWQILRKLVHAALVQQGIPAYENYPLCVETGCLVLFRCPHALHFKWFPDFN